MQANDGHAVEKAGEIKQAQSAGDFLMGLVASGDTPPLQLGNSARLGDFQFVKPDGARS
jgi:hypothetical protein